MVLAGFGLLAGAGAAIVGHAPFHGILYLLLGVGALASAPGWFRGHRRLDESPRGSGLRWLKGRQAPLVRMSAGCAAIAIWLAIYTAMHPSAGGIGVLVGRVVMAVVFGLISWLL